MKFYILRKIDTKSDYGSVDIVVRARNIIKAMTTINIHLHNHGRGDLEVMDPRHIQELEMTPNGLIYSNLQSLGD